MDKGFHAFQKDIIPKVNRVAQLDFELFNFEAEDLHYRHYAPRTLPGFKLGYK